MNNKMEAANMNTKLILSIAFGLGIILLLNLGSYSQSKSVSGTDGNNLKVYAPTNGYLKIHTAIETRNDEGIELVTYKSYKVFDESGKFIMSVERSLGEPRTVKLTEGTYIVLAEMKLGKPEKFKVIVVGGKITEVEK
jgi:hypothetical protein